jgi:hypothetical protein
MMTVDDDLDLDLVDKAALELAMRMARREEGRGEQLDAMLKSEPWFTVAQFAAYCCQTTNLNLKPWETPPCWVIDPDDPDNTTHTPKENDGRRNAAKLRRQLRKHGISAWHPDPLAALESAKRTQCADGGEE